MGRTAALSMLLLLAACGGSKITLSNGTGIDLDTVKMTINEDTQTWNSISADQTFSTYLTPGETSSPVTIEWEADGETWSMDYMLIENASEAEKISILFAPDEISINYSF